MATADKAFVVGTVKAGFDLQASLPWASSQPATKVNRNITLAIAKALAEAENVSFWSGVFTVPALGHGQWQLAAGAFGETNSLNLMMSADRVYMIWIRNLSEDYEIQIESDSGGIGFIWPEFLEDGSYMHLPPKTTLIAFSEAGWAVGGSGKALSFDNKHATQTVDVECGVVAEGIYTP